MLVYYGIVGSIPAVNQFTCESLSGLGSGKFTGALGNPYHVFVLRDVAGAGAAPQGESRPITGYNANGTFSHNAFSAPLTQGDEVLIIHPALAAILPTGINQGLLYFGKVTNVPGVNQFTIPALAGLRADRFCGGGASHLNPYQAFVTWDAAGIHTAPQGQSRNITGYNATSGVFTTDPYTVPVGIDDEILVVHPALASMLKMTSSTGVLLEQADIPVNINAITASETNVLNLATADTRYLVRHCRLKCADPGANTVTVRLYELINDVLTVVGTFDVTNAGAHPFTGYYSLMDMFGTPTLAGDNLKVTVQASAGGPYAVTGQYSYAKTNN